jgi:hypothetical protein
MQNHSLFPVGSTEVLKGILSKQIPLTKQNPFRKFRRGSVDRPVLSKSYMTVLKVMYFIGAALMEIILFG